jgi:hypothetical protein
MRAQRKPKHSPFRGEIKNLTLGDLIAGTYSARGEKKSFEPSPIGH